MRFCLVCGFPPSSHSIWNFYMSLKIIIRKYGVSFCFLYICGSFSVQLSKIKTPISHDFEFQVLVFLTPETPAWLASHGRPSDAQESFRWLRGHGSEAAAELQALMQKQHEHLSTGSSSSAAADWLKQLLRASFLKPFLIMNVFFVIQQFSGVNAVAFYTVSNFWNMA